MFVKVFALKKKPDRVVVHRIELQQFERNLIEQAATAYSINKILTPAVDLMKDVSGMIVFASLLTYIGIKVNMSGITSNSSMANVVERIDDAFRLAREQKNLQSVPKGFIDSFFEQLAGKDWRFDLDPRADED